MVTVAKSLNAPVKLLFPKSLFVESTNSMLGLGDIILPGAFVALLLRYDFERRKADASFSKTYFNATFISYTIGLITTICVMHYFRAAQPALLYLVPAVLIGSGLTALILRDTENLLEFGPEDKVEEGSFWSNLFSFGNDDKDKKE
eukprot:TRINITY_DN7204_c0_g1_i3.p2 TRINITY_DN7204_c0_g1~~TRINITY_DN7204_c0_g1_i3.p2  ORF type:complete len:146 (-),score=29.42 TRINITY_DN7204_c0_g1_i3:24-461(-)